MRTDEPQRPTCGRCGDGMVPIAYGYPGIELIEAEQRGEVVLGGCTFDGDMPRLACPACARA